MFTASLSKCHWHFFFPGGGTALIRAAQKLESVKPENEDEKLGIEIIRRAVEEPLRMIVECCGCRTCRGNAGLEGSVVVNEVKNGKGDYGYNARAEKYENLFQSGVIDPAKERESSELSPRGPRERRQHRRHAPHHITMLEELRSMPQMPPAFSHLRHQGTRPPMPAGNPGMGGMGGMY